MGLYWEGMILYWLVPVPVPERVRAAQLMKYVWIRVQNISRKISDLIRKHMFAARLFVDRLYLIQF